MTLTAPDLYKPAVEKAAQELFDAKMGGTSDATLIDMLAQICMEDAEKAALAYLNACLEAGEAREAPGYRYKQRDELMPDWIADTRCTATRDFPCLILRMERKP